jgi:hypothetical protein
MAIKDNFYENRYNNNLLFDSNYKKLEKKLKEDIKDWINNIDDLDELEIIFYTYKHKIYKEIDTVFDSNKLKFINIFEIILLEKIYKNKN